MAYTTGTATDYKDLLAAMATFAAANGWTILEQSAHLVFLKGRGLADLDEIYVGVTTYEVPVSTIYNWNMVGSWGWRSGRDISKHPNNSNKAGSNFVVGYFWNAPMTYWMVANGRRIIVVAKVGTTYQMIHLGLLTPPATDNQYPYPLLIGGAGNANTKNYSSPTIGHFWGTYGKSYGAGRMHMPDGSWGTNSSSGALSNLPVDCSNICKAQEGTLLTGLDGKYMLEPVYMVSQELPKKLILGHIEGLFRISGYNNTSENIVAIDEVNYLVIQDCSRSGAGDFCAMRMN